MSSVKQEVAAILMDFTEQMPEDVYMEILRQLGNIPDHKDPKTAAEIQKEFDRVSKENTELDEENDLLREEVENLREETDQLCGVVSNMAFKTERVMSCDPAFEDENVIMFETNEESKSFKQRAFEGRLLIELFNEWRERIDEDMDLQSDTEVETDCDAGEHTFEVIDDEYCEVENDETNISDMYCDDHDWEDEEERVCGFIKCSVLETLKTNFSGKINNYYGAIMLHEKNCWTTQVENAESFNTNPRRSQTKRDLQYMNFTNAKKGWKNMFRNKNSTNYIANTSMC